MLYCNTTFSVKYSRKNNDTDHHDLLNVSVCAKWIESILENDPSKLTMNSIQLASVWRKIVPRMRVFQRAKWILASIRSRFVSARTHPDITTKCHIEWLVWKGSRMPWGQCWHFFSPRSGCAVWSQPTWSWEPFYSVIWRQTHPWTEPKLPWKSEQGYKSFFFWLHPTEMWNKNNKRQFIV